MADKRCTFDGCGAEPAAIVIEEVYASIFYVCVRHASLLRGKRVDLMWFEDPDLPI